MIFKKFTVFLTTLLLLPLTICCQRDPQAQLLKEAYKSHSTELLYKFFDNWSEEVNPMKTRRKTHTWRRRTKCLPPFTSRSK